mgnify:FL=1
MTKDEIGLLLSCIEGDDKELEKYSENKLAKLGFPLEQIEKRKRIQKHKVSDEDIFFLYNNSDPFLVSKAKELTIRYQERWIYIIIDTHFGSYRKYREDLYQCGAVGLLKSLINYNGKHKIQSYAFSYVIHELKGFVYYLQQIPSYYYGEFTNRLRSIENELRLNGEKIEDEVVMKKLGVKRNTLINNRRIQQGGNILSLNNVPDDSSAKMYEVCDTNYDVESIVLKKMYAAGLKEILSELPKPQGDILCLRIINDYSFAEIAETLNISRKKIYRQYQSGIKHLLSTKKGHKILNKLIQETWYFS